MELGLKSRRRIFPPPNSTWASPANDGSVVLPYPVRFASREAFENFVGELERIYGHPMELRIPITHPSGDKIRGWSDPMTSPAEVFAFSAQRVHAVQVSTGWGGVMIDNRTSPRTDVSSQASTLVDGGTPGYETARLTAILAKYVHASPRWRRWPRVPALTDVPAHEVRNRRWQTSVGLWSVFLGGAAGVVGSWIVNGQ